MMPPMKAYPTFDAYLRAQKPNNKAIIRALRKFVAKKQPALFESVKWGNGCWLGLKQPVVYVYSDKEWVQLGFFRGSSLKDPNKMLEGVGHYVRHIKLRAATDIDERKFGALLREAAQFERRLARRVP